MQGCVKIPVLRLDLVYLKRYILFTGFILNLATSSVPCGHGCGQVALHFPLSSLDHLSNCVGDNEAC